MKLSRKEVFNKIDEEREYQNSKWHIDEQKEYSLSEWLTMMKKYINEAENGVYNDETEKALFAVLKISSLGVAAMEQLGTSSRKKETP